MADADAEESALHKSIVEALLAATPVECHEVILEFLWADESLEITVLPLEAAERLPDALTEAIVALSARLEAAGQRLRSGRYRVIRAARGGAEFDASFGFYDPPVGV